MMSEPAVAEPPVPAQDEDDRALLIAIAQGLADDAADQVMDTATLKRELERARGPIAWR
jgi:hypothetical protein